MFHIRFKLKKELKKFMLASLCTITCPKRAIYREKEKEREEGVRERERERERERGGGRGRKRERGGGGGGCRDDLTYLCHIAMQVLNHVYDRMYWHVQTAGLMQLASLS